MTPGVTEIDAGARFTRLPQWVNDALRAVIQDVCTLLIIRYTLYRGTVLTDLDTSSTTV